MKPQDWSRDDDAAKPVRQQQPDMKKCPYCGRQFPDEALVCAIDENTLVPCVARSMFALASVAAPFISGIIFFNCLDAIMYSCPPFVFWSLISTPIWAIFLAVISLVRREPRRVLASMGLILNSGAALVLIYGFTHLQFGC